MREVISTGDAPGSPLFSQAVRVGDQIFVSGMAGIDVGTGRPPGPSIQEQTRQSLANCRAVLEAAGAGLDDVVEVGILLADPDDFAGMNEAYAVFFDQEPPARAVTRLGPDLPGIRVSIMMAAHVDS